ncbi:DUF1499 domain-containing protein [Hyphococcus lacteus]|uniref:DUF1499 domain-containing protein n=1 Tax=Hyphococcus lacteus TaxID=3143536 RepID=A0ABV3Z577_9PROT
MRVFITLISLAALGCALTIAFSGPGTQLGWWDYGTGLKLIRQVSSPIEITGGFGLSPIFTLAGLSLLGGVASLVIGPRGLGIFAIVCGLVAIGAAQVPLKMRADVAANPFIHDVTTDFDNPPPIVAGASKDRKNPPEYVGDEMVRGSELTVAQAQAAAFPDLTAHKVNAGLDETAEIVRHLLDDMGMDILDETLGDEGWLIEAEYKSKWFGFYDDFVVRLTPEGSLTRVDVRSKSRVGGSDLGANAARMRAFFEKLDASKSL